MNDRHEPTISSLPSDRDEQGVARPPRAPQGQRKPPPVADRPKQGGSKLAVVALLAALLALALAGFLYKQLQESQQQLQASNTQIIQSERRIADLEGRLRLADNESTQSLTVLQANIKENSAEIRKLWGVANDRNRKAIDQLKADAAKLQETVASLDAGLKQQVTEVAGEVKVLSDLMEGQQSIVARADRAVSSQTETLKELSEKLSALDSDLRKRVGSNEEAIKAIDAFRLQINREMLQLKGG